MNYTYGMHIYLQQLSRQPKLKTADSSGTLVHIYQCTCCHNQECDNIYLYYCLNTFESFIV